MDLPRTRECIALVTDLSFPVLVDDAMARGGWLGGSVAMWTASSLDTFAVTYANGLYSAFCLWGSSESSDVFSAYTENQRTYAFAVACVGTWVISTVAYEKYTLRSRLNPPLVEHQYKVGERLKISNRGLWYPATSEDEWVVISDPRGENPYLTGSIVQAPTTKNNFHLMVQTAL